MATKRGGTGIIKKILLVEDFALVSKQFTKLLEVDHYRVHPVYDGEQAIQAIVAEPSEFFCIILDLGLPNLDGFGVIKWMRENKIEIPVIAVSGQIDRDVLLKLAKLRVIHVLSKPLQIYALHDKLAQVKPRPVLQIGYVCTHRESVDLLTQSLDKERFLVEWVNSFEKVHQLKYDALVIHIMSIDRDWQKLIDEIRWKAIRMPTYVVAGNKVHDYCGLKDIKPHLQLKLPIGYDVFKASLEAIEI